MTINVYIIIVTLVFTYLAIIWSKRSWLDVTLKFMFILLAGSGAYLIFVHKLLPF